MSLVKPATEAKPPTANEITAALLVEITGRFFPKITVWRNNRIDAMAMGRNGQQRRVSAGIDGQGDITGLFGPLGRRIEIEIKAGKDRLRPSQLAFRAMIERHGGVYIVATSVDQCLSELEKICRS